MVTTIKSGSIDASRILRQNKNNNLFWSVKPRCLFQLNKEDKRIDGRKADQMRAIFMKCGVVTQARGSAYVEMVNCFLYNTNIGV